jgi:hypothetical protein
MQPHIKRRELVSRTIKKLEYDGRIQGPDSVFGHVYTLNVS